MTMMSGALAAVRAAAAAAARRRMRPLAAISAAPTTRLLVCRFSSGPGPAAIDGQGSDIAAVDPIESPAKATIKDKIKEAIKEAIKDSANEPRITSTQTPKADDQSLLPLDFDREPATADALIGSFVAKPAAESSTTDDSWDAPNESSENNSNRRPFPSRNNNRESYNSSDRYDRSDRHRPNQSNGGRRSNSANDSTNMVNNKSQKDYFELTRSSTQDQDERNRGLLERMAKFELSEPVKALRRKINTYDNPDISGIRADFPAVLKLDLTKDDISYLSHHGLLRFVYLCLTDVHTQPSVVCQFALETAAKCRDRFKMEIENALKRMLMQIIFKCSTHREFEGVHTAAKLVADYKIPLSPWIWGKALSEAMITHQDPHEVLMIAERIHRIRAFEPSVNFYSTLIRELGSHKFSKRAEIIFEDAIERLAVPEALEVVYVFMFRVFMSCNMEPKARLVMKQLESYDWTLNVRTYNTIIHTWVNYRKFNHALDVYRLMKRKNVEPNVVTYNLMISAIGKEGIPEYKMLIQDCVQSKVPLDSEVYNSIISVLGKNKHLKEAVGWFEQMREKRVHMDMVTYNALIAAYQYADDMKNAERILFGLESQYNVRPDLVSFNILLRGYTEANDIVNARRIYEEILLRRFVPDMVTFSYRIRIEGGADIRRIPDLLRELKAYKVEPSMLIFESILRAHAIAPNSSVDQILKTYEEATQIVKKVGGRVYIMMNALHALEKYADRKAALALFEDIKEFKMRPPPQLINLFAHYFATVLGDMGLVRYLNAYITLQRIRFGTGYYNTVLKFVTKRSDGHDTVDDLRKHMDDRTIAYNAETYMILIPYYLTKAIASHLNHVSGGTELDGDVDIHRSGPSRETFLYAENPQEVESSDFKLSDVVRNAPRRTMRKQNDVDAKTRNLRIKERVRFGSPQKTSSSALTSKRSGGLTFVSRMQDRRRMKESQWCMSEAEMLYNMMIGSRIVPDVSVYTMMMEGYLDAMRVGLPAPESTLMSTFIISQIRSPSMLSLSPPHGDGEQEKSEAGLEQNTTRNPTETIPVIPGWAGRLINLYHHAKSLNVDLNVTDFKTVLIALERMAYGTHIAKVRSNASTATVTSADAEKDVERDKTLDAIADATARVYYDLRNSAHGVSPDMGDLVLRCFAAVGRWDIVDMTRLELSEIYKAAYRPGASSSLSSSSVSPSLLAMIRLGVSPDAAQSIADIAAESGRSVHVDSFQQLARQGNEIIASPDVHVADVVASTITRDVNDASTEIDTSVDASTGIDTPADGSTGIGASVDASQPISDPLTNQRDEVVTSTI